MKESEYKYTLTLSLEELTVLKGLVYFAQLQADRIADDPDLESLKEYSIELVLKARRTLDLLDDRAEPAQDTEEV